ncbi:MAG: hypothetical protein PHT02_14575 [Tissierellia bacterium]|nr:hypothetical protein [Tissierellia bacterium]
MKKHFYKLFLSSIILVILIISGITLKILLEGDKCEDNKEVESLKSEKLLSNFYIKQTIQESVINDNLYIDILEKDAFAHYNKDKPLLVFRYSALNCNECVEFGFKKIEEFFDDYKKNSNLLFVLSDHISEKETQNNNINLKKEKLGLPFENSNQPFYFLLFDNQVRHVFIPDKNYPEYTDTYLSEIKRRYFSNK